MSFDAPPRPRPPRASVAGRRPGSDRRGRQASRPRKRKAPLWTRMLIILGSVVMVISGATVIIPKLAIRWAASDIERADVIPPDLGANIDGAINFLLIGSDTRSESEGYLTSEALADSIVLVHIPKTHDQVYMISLPRDLRVQIVRSADSCDGGYDKINAAFQMGVNKAGGKPNENPAARDNGAVFMMKTISCLVQDTGGLKFSGWANVNFEGFDKIVEQIGGVYLCVDTDVWSIHYNAEGKNEYFPDSSARTRPQRKHYTEGECRDFAPWEALDYSRQRYDLGDGSGDFGRQRHQQQLIKAIINKIASADTLANFGTINSLKNAAGDLLRMDLGSSPIEDWVFTLSKLRADSLIMIKTYAGGTGPGGWHTENWKGNTKCDSGGYIDGVRDPGCQSFIRVDDDLLGLLRAAQNDTVFDFLASHPTWAGGT